MSYLKFNKDKLVNLEYSLKREVVEGSSTGGFYNTTIVCCNTRRYHGLLIVPIDNFEGRRHVLLSALDETLIQQGHDFNLGIRCYGNIYEPRGHKYIVDFEFDKAFKLTYRVGGMRLTKTMLFAEKDEQLLIKYTLEESQTSATLRLKPFLAFRDIHLLTHANTDADTRYREISNGCSFNMYSGFPDLNLQINKKSEFVSNPDWYKNVLYNEEMRRGYEFREDLFSPGFFDIHIACGESIIFSASTKEVIARSLKQKYNREYEEKRSRDSFESCLKLADNQFIIKRGEKSEICSGFPWLAPTLRDSLIALPGVTLFNDAKVDEFREMVDSLIKSYNSDFFKGTDQSAAPLWLILVLQRYAIFTGDRSEIKRKFGDMIKKLLSTYIEGSRFGVRMDDNGMLWCEAPGVAMSWMNAYVEGEPVTERAGYQVETNALWYNALSFAIELFEEGTTKDDKCLAIWREIRGSIDKNFMPLFWYERGEYLADYVDKTGQDKSVRPNQVIACALPYSPIPEKERDLVIKRAEKELLTAKGIRTLSPRNTMYKGRYEGGQQMRDLAYHQGSTRVWLLGYYIEASFRLYGKTFINRAKELISAFEEDMTIHGVGSIAELYDGDPPHFQHGAISYAASVAELIRVKYLIDQQEKLISKEEKL